MLKSEVIKSLLGQKNINGSLLASRLGVSRNAVWKVIQELRSEGFEISSKPNRGYSLESHPDIISAELIDAYIKLQPWNLLVFDSLDSTNNEAKRLADGGLKDRSVLLSDEQTGGKGRLGRSFVSKKGLGLYMSVFLRPSAAAGELTPVTSLAAIAVKRALLKTAGVTAGIKWPNDIILNGKKLCGILTELSVEGESGSVQYLVIGIGVNVGYGSEDFPQEIRHMCTSLKLENAPAGRAELAAAILDELSKIYTEGRFSFDHEIYLSEYIRDCITIGRDVKISGTDSLTGRAVGLDEDFGLVVELENGKRITVQSGEVSVRGLYGYAD